MKPSDVDPMSFDEALKRIAGRAQRYEISSEWPVMDLVDLHAAGAMRWALPGMNGGDHLSGLELHLRYEKVATASVATALILTQRDAAVGLIEAADNTSRRTSVLNQLVTNEIWATVGIAQLTTSRQGGTPAVTAQRVDGGYLVNGTIPWCTGAAESGFIVAGATLADAQQILVLLKTTERGVRVDEPMRMVALSNTQTSSIQLNEVMIENSTVLRGPANGVLGGRRNGLTLGQTFIATGLTQAALNLIADHNSDRARAAHGRFCEQLAVLRAEVADLCQPGREADAGAANARLRGACNDLALRATHAAMALYKGAALLADHPAQRLAREAMFLLVWSCPNPVIDCTVDLLSERVEKPEIRNPKSE
jgi:alkylation response protein AidB-like acyl-CoA dehydrogenase